MFPCPHCGKAIETGPPPDFAWYKYDPGGTRVSLGCGTLILIAIIVAMFSRVGDESDEIRDMRQEIQTLGKKIDNIELKAEVAGNARPGENNP
jgi:hypothetical protein